MRFHVNPKTGNTGRCSASVRECPYGGEEVHFDSETEARQAYEKSQQSVVAPVKKTGSQIELAKVTKDRDEQVRLAGKGPRIVASLLSNPDVHSDALEVVSSKSTDARHQHAAVIHPNFDASKLTVDGVKSLLDNRERQSYPYKDETPASRKIEQLIDGGHLDMEKVDALKFFSRYPNYDTNSIRRTLTNAIRDGRVSPEVSYELARFDRQLAVVAIESGNSLPEVLDLKTSYVSKIPPAGPVRERIVKNTCDSYAASNGATGDYYMSVTILNDPTVTPQEVDALYSAYVDAKTAGRRPMVDEEQFYFSPGGENVRKKLEASDEDWANYGSVCRKLGGKEFGSANVLKELSRSQSKGAGANPSRGYHITVHHLDEELLKRYDISHDELRSVAGKIRTNGPVVYDPVMNTITVTMDSGD